MYIIVLVAAKHYDINIVKIHGEDEIMKKYGFVFHVLRLQNKRLALAQQSFVWRPVTGRNFFFNMSFIDWLLQSNKMLQFIAEVFNS